MIECSTLILGVVCAAVGGELFVRGAVGLARWARIAPGLVAATVAAFATSSSELSVSIGAALAGTPQIALGDALGSNVVNIALVLGLALAISAIRAERSGVKRDFPVALLIPVITGILVLDGELSRFDGILMLGMFAAWLVATIFEARRQRSAAVEARDYRRRWRVVLSCVGGFLFLVAAGRLVVHGARGLAATFDIDQFIVGATIVAIGTSVPELATSVVAKLRGHDEVSLGTLLGSNIFNGLLIVAVAATIHPITVDWREVAVALVFGIVALLLVYPARDGLMTRTRGVMLLTLYGVYLATILQ